MILFKFKSFGIFGTNKKRGIYVYYKFTFTFMVTMLGKMTTISP